MAEHVCDLAPASKGKASLKSVPQPRAQRCSNGGHFNGTKICMKMAEGRRRGRVRTATTPPAEKTVYEKGLLRAVSSHADAARMAAMLRGGLRRPSTSKTWRTTTP